MTALVCCDPTCGHQTGMHDDSGACRWSGCKCPGWLAGITEREMSVLRCLAGGVSVKDSASALGLSTSTISAHKYNMFLKTGAKSTLELILGAVRSGVIPLESLPALKARVEIHRR